MPRRPPSTRSALELREVTIEAPVERRSAASDGGAARDCGDEQEPGLPVCAGLDGQVSAFRSRPLGCRYPHLWLDAKVERVREPGGVRQKALVIAYGLHESGRREVIGLDVGEAETEASGATSSACSSPAASTGCCSASPMPIKASGACKLVQPLLQCAARYRASLFVPKATM